MSFLSLRLFQIITKDGVTVSVKAVVHYRVVEAARSVVNVENHHTSVQLLASTTLRTALSTRTLAQILAERPAIVADMRRVCDEASLAWGCLLYTSDAADE